MSFPTQPEELTASWLSDVLAEAVEDFTVERFGEGAGIIGQVTRVHLHTPVGSRSIIAKFASPSPDNRAVAAMYDMYGREVDFYNSVASHIDLRVPTCYFAEIERQDQSFVILMEDLADMRIGDQVKGCSETEAVMVVEGMARLHASLWDPDIELVSHNNPTQRDGMIGGFQMGWPVVSQQFPDLMPDEADRVAAAVPNVVGTLLEQMTEPPVSITHADVRLDNVFFSEDGIALVDWQSVCTSAPEQDLAYFVTQSLTDEVRNARDWVALYHQTLIDQGIEDYDLNRCRQRYRVCALYLLCYAATIAGTLDLGNERGLQLGRTLFGNCIRSLRELDGFDLLFKLSGN